MSSEVSVPPTMSSHSHVLFDSGIQSETDLWHRWAPGVCNVLTCTVPICEQMTGRHSSRVLIRKTGPSVNARSVTLLALCSLLSILAVAKETRPYLEKGLAEIGV